MKSIHLQHPTDNLPASAGASAKAGAIVEISPVAQEIVGEIARRVRSHTGAGLIVDYGYTSSAVGDTLQAVHRHTYAPVLERPGEADLTAHVDFSALAKSARLAGLSCWGAIPQGVFLRRLGIAARADTLTATAASAAQKADIESALERLIGDDQMGTLFKVLAISSSATPASA